MKLVVGLGNPGKNYQKTRHNVGFMVLDRLHDKLKPEGINDWQVSGKFNAQVSGLTRHGEKIILAKPLTYMNMSGQAVQLLAHYYKIMPVDMVVAHDDIDIELGKIKIQKKRGSAGHKGIESIVSSIGSNDFLRVRIGIRVKEKKMKQTVKFVLSKFSYMEKRKLDLALDTAVEEIYQFI